MDKNKREQHWEDIVMPEHLKVFPSRIQKHLQDSIVYPEQCTDSGVYFFGAVGTGKTLQAAKQALAYVKWDFDHHKVSRIGFYSIPELLMRIRRSFSPDVNEDEWTIVKEVTTPTYLILDDLGVEKSSDWSLQTLYVILNRRYENLQPVLVTSNYSLQSLEKKIADERIVSRLRRMCDVIKL